MNIHEVTKFDKIARKSWNGDNYLTKELDEIYINTYYYDKYDHLYRFSSEELAADDWFEYSTIGYVNIYMTSSGQPSMTVISEDMYLNDEFPKNLNYMIDWIRFDSRTQKYD